MARLFAAYISQGNQRRERIYRNRVDAFSLYDENFEELFRLPKYIAKDLCSSLRSELEPTSGIQTALSVETQVLCALRFYATGSYQKAVGQDLTLTISQASVSRCIKKVAGAINKILFQEITFPTPSEYPELKSKFMAFGFPGVIGAIDGTLIKIIAPPEPLEECYVDRKGNHSINVQLVCDTNLRILNINAKYPGRSHDAFIWRSSVLREILEDEHRANNSQNAWLLGDSGYPLEPWLMTPVLHATTEPEEKYNRIHRKARNPVERCNGVLKSRFRCLHKHRTLNYTPSVASQIINACAVLHNLCIKNNIDFESESDSDSDSEDAGASESPSTVHLNASSLRSQLINNHFA